MEEQTTQGREHDGKRDERRRLVLIICVCLIALAVLLAQTCWKDPNASEGHFEQETNDQIQADLDAKADCDSMEISVAGVMEMAEGETTVEARLENVEENHCDQKVRMYLADNPRDVLYESGAILPGECIRYIELSHPLPKGTHEMVVEFQGFEPDVTLMAGEGALFGHKPFGASCAALVEVRVTGGDEA